MRSIMLFALFNSFHHGHKLRSFRKLLGCSRINRRIYSCQFGGPLACSVFLIVLSIAGENHLQTVWRVSFGVGILLPLTVLIFRLRMLSSKLYRKGAIKSNHFPLVCLIGSRSYKGPCLDRVPYYLVLKRYWRSLIGTCGAW
jgi:hypothetical protein